MREMQMRMMKASVEKAESELRAQHNAEHCSLLGVQITTLRLEESQNALETSKLMLQHWKEIDSTKKLPKITGGFSS